MKKKRDLFEYLRSLKLLAGHPLAFLNVSSPLYILFGSVATSCALSLLPATAFGPPSSE